jgi:VCBS repeat-containing protein
VLFTDAGTNGNATRTHLTMGFRNDTLIGLRDGQVYRHSLSIARGTMASVIDQVIQQVAIGIRSRGPNNPPVLRPLPSVQATEDMPASVQTSDWTQATSDSDQDSIHYVIVRGGQLGTVSWSTSSGGVYTPKSNANGQDQFVVQAYDGRGWSTPQTVSIQIQPVNDAPQGLLYSGVLAIPEKQPGYVLGSLSIVDPDANEVFDYSVSDGRFEVVGNTLKVRDTAIIPYQNPGWIDLVLSARSRTNGDTIDRAERIFIVQDPTPFHNDTNPWDVDGDGRITPLDPLIIINYINSNGSGQIQPPGEGEAHNDMDVDGDGQVSPLDILLVINALNQTTGDAEGEQSGTNSNGNPAPVEFPDPLGLRKSRR